MARYINADKLYPTNFEIYTYAGDYKQALKAVYEKIDNAPAEDVVPVVRCKNCKYAEFVDDRITCEYTTEWLDPNGYCSMGEKNDGEIH